MPSPTELSATPNENTSVGGINIAENCPAGNLNNAIRYLCAIVRTLYDSVPNVANFVSKTGGIFTDQPKVNGRGGLLHHNDPTLASARVFVQPSGNAAPGGMVNGDFLVEY